MLAFFFSHFDHLSALKLLIEFLFRFLLVSHIFAGFLLGSLGFSFRFHPGPPTIFFFPFLPLLLLFAFLSPRGFLSGKSSINFPFYRGFFLLLNSLRSLFFRGFGLTKSIGRFASFSRFGVTPSLTITRASHPESIIPIFS